jgi:hypothetical protein
MLGFPNSVVAPSAALSRGSEIAKVPIPQLRHRAWRVFVCLLVVLTTSTTHVQGTAALEAGVKWRVMIGGSNDGWINRVIQTHDGGIVAVGYTGRDRDPRVPERWTAIALKYSADGGVVWSRRFQTKGMNAFWAVRESANGNLVVGGFSSEVVGAAYDARLTVLRADGQPILERSFGGPKDDRATDVLITRDNGYLLIGQTESFGAGERDVMLVKTDESGTQKWLKTYGGPGMDRGFAAVETQDGGFVIAGVTGSEAKSDGLILKVDADGNQLWRQTLSADHNVIPHFINLLANGNLLVTGYTDSWNSGATDFLAVTLSARGEILRIDTLGGAKKDHGITAGDDLRGGLWLAGYSKSFGAGAWNATLAHVNSDGSFEPKVDVLDRAEDSYATTMVALRGGDLIVGGYARISSEDQSRSPILMRLNPNQSIWSTANLVEKRVQ